MKRLQTAIAGSFKFKPEIDDLHAEFADHGIEVLEPTKGWLYIASRQLYGADGFRPLPAERHMPGVREIEDRFLAALRRSDFLYLYNPGQYLGNSAAFEFGAALAHGKPIFAKESISLASVDYELDNWRLMNQSMIVADPAEVAKTMESLNEQSTTQSVASLVFDHL